MPYGYPADPQTLGEHLRKRRIDLNLLQREVALRFGVDGTSVWNWENGNSSPTVSVWPAILEFLEYDPRPAGRTIGERLRRYREGRGLSQTQAAEAIGADPCSVRKWESQPDERHDHRSISRIARFIGEDPMDPPSGSLGDRIRHARYLAGLSQRELGERLGLGGGMVSLWELGAATPSAEQTKSIEHLLAVQDKKWQNSSAARVRSDYIV